MAKYNTYIELSPHFESVVDLDAEERNPNLWQEYIVNEDMQHAIEKICLSFRHEIPDARRSFWIHGAYGTGKSYAAIVLKHVFEESIPNLQSFLSRPKLIEHRNKFLALREKGEYLVVWKSGCTGITTGIQLMMAMEMCIREKLINKFGDAAYLGKTSLINAAQRAINNKNFNWEHIFSDPTYRLSEDYASFDEFRLEVLASSLNACNIVAKISFEQGWAFFSTVEMFEDWLEDIIQGNHLGETGIVFIWDEFTSFVRQCGDDNVLQRLAEYCKQQPFFMFLIVHIEPSWVASLGEETYKRILHRYHELEFHITESAAYELIGDSIIIRPAMQEQWEEIKVRLMKSLKDHLPDFDDLSLGNQRERLRQLIPIHPMTLSLLAIVSQNFGASQRTLFRFMKDKTDEAQQVGFIHYINNHGPDDWRWLTPDFLWDYFFTRESDIKGELSQEARRCYQHYQNKKSMVESDHSATHIFKAVMLLLAVMSTEMITLLKSQQVSQKLQATKRSIYRCFAGQLTHNDIDKYLEAFEANGMIRLDHLPTGDARLELPYSGTVEVFDIRLEQTKRKYTRYELFKKNSIFSKKLEEKIWDPNRNTNNRVQIAVCSSETTSLNLRKNELLEDLNKYPYKVGILVVTISEQSQFASMQSTIKAIAKNDQTGRLVVCLVKEPLTKQTLERWHENITHKELAAEEGLRGNANQYENEAAIILETWSQSAAEGQLFAFYQDTQYPTIYGKDDLVNRIEKDVIFEKFSAAPEHIVSVSTAFKKANQSAATAGITLTASSAQITNIARGIQATKAWDAKSLSELETLSDSPGAQAIAVLVKFIHGKLSQGAKVKLDDLWVELQETPYGYYDCLVCAYLLGFVLRFYKDGAFNWIDHTSNTFPLTEQNLSTLVYKLCRGELHNNFLSSGSEIWQNFQPYAKDIFDLKLEESTNEEQTRKYIRERIIISGTPLWVIKYMHADNLGGAETKEFVDNQIDAFIVFISGDGDIESIMSEVVTLFRGRGILRKIIKDAVQDTAERHEAFKLFIYTKQPEIRNLVDSIGINPIELLDSIKLLMQANIYTWTEEQVIEKLEKLVLDYQIIDILNQALLIKRKTLTKITEDLSNHFSAMKVPGAVIESFAQPWVPALKQMRTISKDGWKELNIEEKKKIVEILQEHAKTTWEYLKSAKLLLKEYLNNNSIQVTEDELNNIYSGLILLPYDTQSVSFKDSIQKFLEDITYEREKHELLSLWKSVSGQDTVTAWCSHYATPIQWVLDDVAMEPVATVKDLNDEIKVDQKQLAKALSFFQQSNQIRLQDRNFILQKFLNQIGEHYSSGFLEYQEEIIGRIRIKLGADIFAWGTKAGEIRNIIENFLREKMVEKHLQSAKNKIMNMSEKELREIVIKLIEECPEFCERFLI